MTPLQKAIADFRDFASCIVYTEDDGCLDHQLGRAGLLLHAARQEIDRIWADRRESNRKPSVEAKLRASGLLESLGLMRKVEIERRD